MSRGPFDLSSFVDCQDLPDMAWEEPVYRSLTMDLPSVQSEVHVHQGNVGSKFSQPGSVEAIEVVGELAQRLRWVDTLFSEACREQVNLGSVDWVRKLEELETCFEERSERSRMARDSLRSLREQIQSLLLQDPQVNRRLIRDIHDLELSCQSAICCFRMS